MDNSLIQDLTVANEKQWWKIGKDVENVKEILGLREVKIKHLEFQNRNLERANDQLTDEIKGMCLQISAYQDYKSFQEGERSGMGNVTSEIQKCWKQLHNKLEIAEQQHKGEKCQASKLRHVLEGFEQIWEVQKNAIIQLKG
ncbi:transmembrane and coiled-coil domain-containing protein 5B-like [Platysternon megacephalum]|uniref:Transmembrane and coiled-coil domain-containing protein 5B-like n=1 Tax=Platysternon megacephalum TaxID=55544 RepID=A0A4D9F459_9SAUR|nr:transmembrane and coiled-coil domain-containing protein 5B-like [Platysternon megacephalum]